LLQRWIAGYRVDFLWPEYGLILEADGRVKYAGDEGWAEKKRQVALVRAGFHVERVLWSDLFDGWPAMRARLRPYFLRSAPGAVSSWSAK
jgi:very-short-patch-repair endonuclease